MNRGDPPVYFPTPKYIIDAYVGALRESKTSYSRAEGEPVLVEAVQKRYKQLYGIDVGYESIIVTQGVSEALSFVNSAFVNMGDMAVVFKPYYPLYVPILRRNGGIPLFGSYDESKGWGIDVDRLERALRAMPRSSAKRIKYLLITNPNNPTGTVLDRRALERVVDLANEHSLLIISDEIYDEIVYNGARFTSVGELAKGIPHMILNGASKDFDATGFRIGFMLIPEDDRVSMAVKAKMADYAKARLSVNTPAQYAVAAAMNNTAAHRSAIHEMVRGIAERANHAAKLVAENPLLSVVRPNGAFYIFPKVDLKAMGFRSDAEFVDKLLKATYVQLTRGSGFGAPSHIRIVALPPKDILDYAINKINDFCRTRARNRGP
ncbi:MAG: pyridoxal phosphate-dependent aminotransferase [Candidatus Micrarchaeia archaeon]